jgi:hypothetical protein
MKVARCAGGVHFRVAALHQSRKDSTVLEMRAMASAGRLGVTREATQLSSRLHHNEIERERCDGHGHGGPGTSFVI